MSVNTVMVEVEGSAMPVLVFMPPDGVPGAPRLPGLVVAQHLPVAHTGLENDPFQLAVGERYAAAGYAVAMPWLFHWWPSDADVADKRAQFRDDRTVADLRAAFTALVAHQRVDPDRMGILGHCWGGRVAWLGACHEPRYRACAVFYGGRIKLPFADAAPAPIGLAGNMRAAVLGIFGNEDQGPSPADVDDYQAALREAGVRHTFHRYDGAGHGFQDFTNADRFRPDAAQDAWDKALAFFAAELGKP